MLLNAFIDIGLGLKIRKTSYVKQISPWHISWEKTYVIFQENNFNLDWGLNSGPSAL